MAHSYRDNNSTLYKFMCAIVFILFTFIYLYFFQADLLFMIQHVLSGGATHYNRTIGTFIITDFVLACHPLGRTFACSARGIVGCPVSGARL